MRTIILDILKDFFRGTHGQSFFNETDTLVQRAGEFFPPPLVMSMKAESSLIFPSSSFRRVSAHEVGSALGDGLYSAGRGLDQLQPLQTRMAVLADDDVVVHGNAERPAMSTIARVIWISACDGVGSPEG